MNDKEFDKWLKEQWRPFNDWKGDVSMRVARLEVRTKLALAKSAYFKAQAEMRTWQRATAGRRGGAATHAAPGGLDASVKGGGRRRRVGIGK